MKKFVTKFLLIIFIVGIASCSKSSSDDIIPTVEPPEDNSVPTAYFPLKINNFWNYTIQDHASNNFPTNYNTAASQSADYLFVSSDVVINNISYKKMTTNPSTTYGYFSSILKNNALRRDGTQIKGSGTFNFTVLAGVPFSVSLTDFILFKDNAVSGKLLSTTSSVATQTISGYPLTIHYSLSSYSDGSLPTFLSNNVNYTNIKKTKMIVRMSITTVYAGYLVTVLPEQDVITASLHFAPNIGMVYNNRVLNYELNQGLPPNLVANLGVPTKSNQIQEEFIGAFNASN